MARRVGALWLKSSKDGKRYFSGTLDLGVLGEVQIAILRVEEKRNEKSPDYNIVLSEPKPKQEKTEYDDSGEDIPF